MDRRLFIKLAGSAGAGLFAGCAGGVTRSGEPLARGNLSGSVVNGQGIAVAGATVTAYEIREVDLLAASEASGRSVTRSYEAETDAHGRFTLNVPVGQYELVAEHGDQKGRVRCVDVAEAMVEQATALQVGDTGWIWGVIRKPNGRPYERLSLVGLMRAEPEVQMTGTGRFEFHDLPVGATVADSTYVVAAAPHAADIYELPQPSAVVVMPNEMSKVEFTLQYKLESEVVPLEAAGVNPPYDGPPGFPGALGGPEYFIIAPSKPGYMRLALPPEKVVVGLDLRVTLDYESLGGGLDPGTIRVHKTRIRYFPHVYQGKEEPPILEQLGEFTFDWRWAGTPHSVPLDLSQYPAGPGGSLDLALVWDSGDTCWLSADENRAAVITYHRVEE